MDALDQPVDGLAELGISLHQPVDLVDAMEDGRVISAAERAADVGERGVREVTSEVGVLWRRRSTIVTGPHHESHTDQ